MRSAILAMFLASCAADHNTLDAIPRAAAATLEREAGGNPVSVKREDERGTVVYEGSWQVDGLAHETKVDANGVVLEREQHVREASVPAAVRDAAVRALGGGRIEYVRVENGTYEAEVGERSVTISADGKVVVEDRD